MCARNALSMFESSILYVIKLPLTVTVASPCAPVVVGVGSFAPFRNAMKRSGSGGIEVRPTSSLQLPTPTSTANVPAANTRRPRIANLLTVWGSARPRRLRHTRAARFVQAVICYRNVRTASGIPVPREGGTGAGRGSRRRLRPPRECRRARTERRVDLRERDRGRDGPRPALHRRHADRRHVAARSQVHYRRRGVIWALVGFDHERPGSLRRPRALQGVHALARRLGELELEGASLPAHDPLGRARA